MCTLTQAREIAGGMRATIINGIDPTTMVRVKRDSTAKTLRFTSRKYSLNMLVVKAW